MMKIKYQEIGICGLSCRLCPNYQTERESKCGGCKTEDRMKVGCPFITCAVKKRGIEFCWQCEDQATCEKWARHRELGRSHDSFVCYQKLEHNISIVKRAGLDAFIRDQKAREKILKIMLAEFNEGRSKSYYCIAATVMEVEDMKEAIAEARNNTIGMDLKGRSKKLHELLDSHAENKRYNLKLRK